MRALSAQLAGCATGAPNGFEDAMTGSMRSDDLRSRLVAARGCGVLHLEKRDRDPALAGSDPRAVADALVAALGMAPAGDRWHALDRTQDGRLVQEILHRDLAYSGELMDPAAASAFATEFLGQFDEEAGFFTNSEFATHLVFINQNGFAAGWQPLTEATFDSGVVAVDRRGVGILWVEDEDRMHVRRSPPAAGSAERPPVTCQTAAGYPGVTLAIIFSTVPSPRAEP